MWQMLLWGPLTTQKSSLCCRFVPLFQLTFSQLYQIRDAKAKPNPILVFLMIKFKTPYPWKLLNPLILLGKWDLNITMMKNNELNSLSLVVEQSKKKKSKDVEWKHSIPSKKCDFDDFWFISESHLEAYNIKLNKEKLCLNCWTCEEHLQVYICYVNYWFRF